jgi:hypothetical protein
VNPFRLEPAVVGTADPTTSGIRGTTALQRLGPDSPRVQDLARRLRDPLQREELRLQQRQQLSADHAYMAESLLIDPALAERLRSIHPGVLVVASLAEQGAGDSAAAARTRFDTALAAVRGYFSIEATISARRL